MKWIVGIDEVGRGPLAGPVTVCAVAMTYKAYEKLLDKNTLAGLNDSKQLTEKSRERWHTEARAMEHRGALHIAISSRTAKAIDKKGIAVCIRECIKENLEKLKMGSDPKGCTILLDGSLRAPKEYPNQQTIIRGDSSQKIISMASVVAKVSRDRYMVGLGKKHALYGWNDNKGYGTKAHIQAIKKWGLTPFHRNSFLKRIIATKA
jgi:ribonuclease HII